MRTSSQIAERCVAAAIAACALLATPARGQIRQTTPEGQLACQALYHANGIRPALASALAGEAEAFPKLTQDLGALRTLFNGNLPSSLDRLEPLVSGASYSGKVLLQQEKTVLTVENSLRELIRESLALIGQAHEVAKRERTGRRLPIRIESAQHLPVLLERLSRHAGRIAADEASAEAVFDLGLDLNTFTTLTRGLIDGDAQLKIPAVDNVQQRARLQKLLEDFSPIRASAGRVLGNLLAHVTARESIKHIRKVSDELVGGLQRVCYTPAIRIEPRS